MNATAAGATTQPLLRRISSLVPPIVILFLVPGLLNASSGLAGVRKFEVFVESLHSDATDYGLTKSQIRNDVELKLRLAGIAVAENVSPFLYVNVNVLYAAPIECHVYNVSLSFHQRVTTSTGELVRDAATWDKSQLGLIGKKGMPEAVRRVLKDITDQFLIEYLKANPPAR